MKLLIATFGDVDFLQDLKNHLTTNFGFEIFEAEMQGPVKCRVRRKQVNAEDFIPSINKERGKQKCDFALCITNKDLYVETMNFVFGLSSLMKKSCIVSQHRLKNEYDQIYKKRTIKEAVHELGHLFGLTHCTDAKCVMHFSNTLFDTDMKRIEFCNICKGAMPKAESSITSHNISASTEHLLQYSDSPI